MRSSKALTNQTDSDELEMKIKLASEHIFAEVDGPDEELDLEQIKRKMAWQTPLCDWALGYLVALGDVEVTGKEGDVHVRRKRSHYPFFAKHEE